MTNADNLGNQLLAAVKGYVARALVPIAARIASFEEKIAAIPAGPKGDPGPPGESIKGDPGIDGKDAVIHPDTLALMVNTEISKAIAAMPKAKDGEPGRDAAQMDFITLDETRTYPRGTCAKYRGGVIRAVRLTNPIVDGDIVKAGWEVLWEGMAAFVATQGDDPREITVSAMQTSGTKAVTVFRMPVMIYRGIYKEGTEYTHGDAVTWGGSTWHCNTATKAKPGTGADWSLMVKEGRAGKDGLKGLDGKPGPEGKPGRDLTQRGPDGSKW